MGWTTNPPPPPVVLRTNLTQFDAKINPDSDAVGTYCLAPAVAVFKRSNRSIEYESGVIEMLSGERDRPWHEKNVVDIIDPKYIQNCAPGRTRGRPQQAQQYRPIDRIDKGQRGRGGGGD